MIESAARVSFAGEPLPVTAARTLMGLDQSALVEDPVPRLPPVVHQSSSLYIISYIRGLVNTSINMFGNRSGRPVRKSRQEIEHRVTA